MSFITFASIITGNANVILLIAALDRAQGLKPEDIEEVFFGNVLSAKYVSPDLSASSFLRDRPLIKLHQVSDKIQPDNVPLAQASFPLQYAPQSIKSVLQA